MKNMRKSAIFIVSVTIGMISVLGAIAKPNAADSVAAKVDSLVAMATCDVATEREAFVALVALGDTAVPYIITHLGDMRKLPDRQISLATSNPNVNEDVANYEAEVVHDALSLILQEITHQDIGSRYDGTSLVERNAERSSIRKQWTAFCRTRYPESPCS